MLIDFAITNFRSIKERQVFSMQTVSRITEKPENTIKSGTEQLLRSAVIYGRNASGKSNLLPILVSVPIPALTASTSAPTWSQKFAISFIKEILVAKNAFAAYLVNSALLSSMKMMGLDNYLHWLAWFIKSYFLLLVSIALVIPLLTSKMFNGGELAILTKSDVSLVFFYGRVK